MSDDDFVLGFIFGVTEKILRYSKKQIKKKLTEKAKTNIIILLSFRRIIICGFGFLLLR